MRKTLYAASAILTLAAGSAVAENAPMIGIVNFTHCITDSIAGKKEQENIENLRNQMASLIENSEKELREISAKFEDTEYLDSLSPKAEEELKIKHQSLQEDLMRYQQQFYQVLQHTQYQMVQKISHEIAIASEKVAKEKKLDYVINKEACFYVRPDLDLTSFVVEQMDQNYESNSQSRRTSENTEDVLRLDSLDHMTQDQAG